MFSFEEWELNFFQSNTFGKNSKQKSGNWYFRNVAQNTQLTLGWFRQNRCCFHGKISSDLLDFSSIITRWWFQIFFYFHPYLGKTPILTNIFQRGWNHQLVSVLPTNLMTFIFEIPELTWNCLLKDLLVGLPQATSRGAGTRNLCFLFGLGWLKFSVLWLWDQIRSLPKSVVSHFKMQKQFPRKCGRSLILKHHTRWAPTSYKCGYRL